MSRRRESAAERDERIVAEALRWCGRFSYDLGDFAQQWENYNVMPSDKTGAEVRRDVFQAAARILNRIARQARKGRK